MSELTEWMYFPNRATGNSGEIPYSQSNTKAAKIK
jgi:hypothetical protein